MKAFILIVYSKESYSPQTNPYKIIGLRNGKWFSIKHYKRDVLHKRDSVIENLCQNCEDFFSGILNCGLILLPDESMIISDCKKIKDTVINGQPVAEITDLNAITDLEIHRIELKLGNQKKAIAYRSPDYALKICPESHERKTFLKIISIIDKAP